MDPNGLPPYTEEQQEIRPYVMTIITPGSDTFNNIEYIKENCFKLNKLTELDEYWKDLQYYLHLFGHGNFVQCYYKAVSEDKVTPESFNFVRVVLLGTLNSKYLHYYNKHASSQNCALKVLDDLRVEAHREMQDKHEILCLQLGSIRLRSAKPKDKAKWISAFEKLNKEFSYSEVISKVDYITILQKAYLSLANDPTYKEQVEKYVKEHDGKTCYNSLSAHVPHTGYYGFMDLAGMVEMIKDEPDDSSFA